MNERDTCRTFVVPGLTASGWGKDQIREQYRITNGPIIASPRQHRHGEALIADYVLEYRDDVPVAVVEAKRTKIDAADGIEQAKRYAKRLRVPMAYATNGREIWEIEIGGAMRPRTDFPSPEELWRRFREKNNVDSPLEQDMLFAPFNTSAQRDYDQQPKRPRYYQRNAVNRVLHAIAQGRRKILLTLATGTGKTMVAFQLVAKLRGSGWVSGRMPRVLYLADRNILIDQPKDDYFAPAFGDVVHKISKGHAQKSREIYFALYQSLDNDDEQALFREYQKDYFDLVIVDECHRGSASASSQWHRILEHFDQAVQIGLTATPIQQEDADTYGYFKNPVDVYSLRDGIEDGFLAPYRVRRVRLSIDMTGFRPSLGQRDVDGDIIPDKLYTPKQYERVLAVLGRTEEAARYLTQYLRETDRMGKTIVFCENNDHAHRMRVALNNANEDMVNQYHDYVFRITDADGDPGRALLSEFKKIGSDEPVIAVTSQLLTTGVDMPSVKNIVIFRRIGSKPLFKQIIGRGTRLCPEIHKGSFDIIDFVEATRLFNDPHFDGPPLRVINDEADTQGAVVARTEEPAEGDGEQVAEAAAEYERKDEGTLSDSADQAQAPDPVDDETADRIMAQGKRIYVDGVEVYVWNDVHYQLESDGRSLRLVEYREFVRDRVLAMKLSPADLRTRWASAKSRAALREQLQNMTIEPDELLAKLGHPEADPLDLLINAAWELPLVSRAERALRVQREHKEFLEGFGPKARAVLDALLDKFAEHGAEELNARVLRVPPFDEMGNVRQLGALFDGPKGLHSVIDELGKRLFDVG